MLSEQQSTYLSASALMSIDCCLLRSSVLISSFSKEGPSMDFQPYIRASWEIVMECENRSKVNLDEELEAYLVYMVARNFRNPDFPPDVICLEFTKARTRDDFRQIGDSCLIVDAWDVRRARLTSQDYYEKLGQAAYAYAAMATRPIDELFQRIAREFSCLSKVLAGVKPQLDSSRSSVFH
jgi:hypothetical protein